MRAVRSRDAKIQVTEVPEPKGDGELVSVRAASICASDFEYIAMGSRFTLGHELSGVAEDGTPVAVEAIFGCHACEACAAGQYNVCEVALSRAPGLGSDGGMADFVRVPARHLVPLPPTLALENASLVEPLAVALHGVRLAGVQPGQKVAIIGGGAIGLLVAAGLQGRGVDVRLSARYRHQIAAGERLGARSLGEGERCDVAIEAGGSESALATAIASVKPAGTLVLLAVHGAGVTLPMTAFLKELCVRHSLAYCAHAAGRDIDDAAQQLADSPEIAAALITHRFPLAAAAEAFRVASDRSSGAIRVVIEP